MANISEASGTVKITAPTEQDAIEIVRIFNKGLNGDYYIRISKDYEVLDNNNESCVISCSFKGLGRWSIVYNIEESCIWVKIFLNRRKMAKETQYLENTSWEMIYDLKEYEPLQSFHGNGSNYRIVHEAGQTLEASKYIKGEWENLPFQ